MSTSSVANTQSDWSTFAATTGGSATSNANSLSASEQSDRFLKLLVTQMKNQDPLNPMDNAQITSQMAQISTVSGIDALNKSIGSMSGLLLQSQSLEAASLVGKKVLVTGNDLALAEDGSTAGGFELAGPADSVQVQIKNPAGRVIDTLNLGAASSGRHGFTWQNNDPKLLGATFTVNALSGGKVVSTTPLVADGVGAVFSDGGQISVETLRHGTVKYADIKAVA